MVVAGSGIHLTEASQCGANAMWHRQDYIEFKLQLLDIAYEVLCPSACHEHYKQPPGIAKVCAEMLYLYLSTACTECRPVLPETGVRDE